MGTPKPLTHAITALLLVTLSVEAEQRAADPTAAYSIKIHDLPFSHHPEYPVFQALLEDHPQVRYKRHTQLQLPNISRGSLLMAIAGGVAPDILRVYHHEAKAWIRNGFFEPLDEWVYEDRDGDGRYTEDVDEVIWKPFLNIPKAVRDIITDDGHIYIVPRFQWIQGLIYRKDIFREYGIDPDQPIRTFDELRYVCQKLTDPHARIAGARRPVGRKGFGVFPDGWMWQGYMFAAGGKSSELVRFCPECRARNMPEALTCAKCQGDIQNVQPVERAAFNNEEGIRALQLWKDLLWGPFTKCQKCKEPIDLGGADARLAFPLDAKCTFCAFETTIESRDDPKLIIGSARPCIGEDQDWKELFVNGEIAVFSRHKEFLTQLSYSDIDSRLVGFMPLPEKGGLTAFHYWGVYAGAKQREGGRDRVRVCAEFALDYAAQFYVPKDDPHYLRYDRHKAVALTEQGFFNLCTRDELMAAGLEEYVKEIPEGSLQMWDMLYDPKHYVIMPATEGYSRVQIQVFGTELLSDLVIDPNYDVRAELARAERLANTQVYEKDERVRELMGRYRTPFVVILVLLVAYVVALLYWVVLRKEGQFSVIQERRLSFGKRAMGVLLLLPAMCLVGLWAYYPLARGSVMAFQDVRIMGGSRWVGIENFVRVVTNPQFMTMVKATVMYVFALLSIGFFAPIVLAILLSEIKRLSVFYRVVYYAPRLLSGVVVLFIWKIFYSPTPDGFLNEVLQALNKALHLSFPVPVSWLQNTSINKWALAFPAVWAGAGSACLVYLAALKSIDDELYEAADIDGAGLWGKVWHITLPSLKPLIIIQFVGAFIHAFHNMGNILVLTGGAYDTNVIGLQIFLESFAFLRFGSAISLAWILGTVLVSFTIFQLGILKKVEFRRAE